MAGSPSKVDGVATAVGWIAVLALVGLGVYVVADRATMLARSLENTEPPPAGSYEVGFATHPVLTAFHIGAGLVFLVLGPLQFSSRLRKRSLPLHRSCGRCFLVASLGVGLSAPLLALRTGFGGPSEMSATLVFSSVLLYATLKGFWLIRRRQIARHREWMIRAFAIGLAVATIRPVAGALISVSGAALRDVLGSAFWIAFTWHLVTAEVWIHRTRRMTMSASP